MSSRGQNYSVTRSSKPAKDKEWQMLWVYKRQQALSLPSCPLTLKNKGNFFRDFRFATRSPSSRKLDNWHVSVLSFLIACARRSCRGRRGRHRFESAVLDGLQLRGHAHRNNALARHQRHCHDVHLRGWLPPAQRGPTLLIHVFD